MKDTLLELKIFLDKSKLRKIVLDKLNQKEQVPIFLSRELKKHRSSISRVLLDFEKMKLAKCINLETNKYHIYQITKLGRQMLKNK